MNTRKFIILGLFLPFFALASYNAYQYNGDGTDRSSATAGGTVGIQYTASSTHYNINRVDVRMSASSLGYEAYLNVYLRNTNTDQFTPIASSSVIVSNGYAWNSFYLDRNLQMMQGGTYTFEIVPDPALGTSTNYIFTSASPIVGTDATRLMIAPYGSTTGLTTLYGSYAGGSNYMSAPLRLYSTNSGAPVVTLEEIPNIECTSYLDIFCQLSKFWTWAWYPKDTTLDEWRSLSLASTSPFGYAYDLDDAYFSVINASATPFSLTTNLSTLGNYADAFGNISTTSTELFNVCWVNRAVGEAGANTYHDYVLPMIEVGMWIGLLWLLYNTAHSLF